MSVQAWKAQSLVDDLISTLKDDLDMDDIYDAGEIKAYVSANFNPEDVFSENELEIWAADNGYTKQD